VHLRERLEALAQAPELERQYGERLVVLWAERDVEEGQKTTWFRDRQDGNELKEQIQQLWALGAEGSCPTCGRHLGEDHERLVGELEEQWSALVQDGKWWKSRLDQLEGKPEEIVGLESCAMTYPRRSMRWRGCTSGRGRRRVRRQGRGSRARLPLRVHRRQLRWWTNWLL
jgi:DNA repair exonuclease SbcCD ATPase subunit